MNIALGLIWKNLTDFQETSNKLLNSSSLNMNELNQSVVSMLIEYLLKKKFLKDNLRKFHPCCNCFLIISINIDGK